MDAKRFLRISWLVQAGLLFGMSIVALFVFPERVDGLVKLMPYLVGITAIQGGVAGGGASLKRATEAQVLKAQGEANGS